MFRKLITICACVLMLAAPGFAFAQDVSPTTGLATDREYQPILVMVSNSEEARPQHNLARADVVYESIYWGPGHTRYYAIYNDEHPEIVGPIRGARVYNVEMMLAWDCPMVHHGGQAAEGTNIFDAFKEYNVPGSMSADSVHGTGAMLGFFREKERISPHNAVYDLTKYLEKNAWPKNEDGTDYAPRSPGLAFSETPSTGEIAIEEIRLDYGDTYEATYVYNAEGNHWERSYSGGITADNQGTPYQYANVIVQVNPLSFYEKNASRPVMETTGKGAFLAFINGTAVSGEWSCDKVGDPVEYLLLDGTPLLLRPGKTFIQMVPEEMFESLGEAWETEGIAAFVNGMEAPEEA